MTFFFVPETAYMRRTPDEVLPVEERPTDEASITESRVNPEKSNPSSVKALEEKDSTSASLKVRDDNELRPGSGKPHKFWQMLLPWNGQHYSEEKYYRIVLRPFSLLLSPVVAWGTLVYGTTQAWRMHSCQSSDDHEVTEPILVFLVVLLSVSVSTLFADPSFGYGYGAGVVGLISGIGPFIAALLGNLIAGPLADWIATSMARRNGGVYEPEYVLVVR